MLTDSTRQADFPALNGMVYLNTAAESIPPQCVGQAIQAYWHDKLRGMRGRDAHFAQVEACRDISARMLHLDKDEVSFCSCSSEAYNLMASALRLEEMDEVVISNIDFPAGATPWIRRPKQLNAKLWIARDGQLIIDDLLPLLSEKTKLVQVSLVSFYNGHRLDWKPFLQSVRRLAPNALIAVDVTQALGRISLDCHEADIVISSTHKWTLGIHGGCIIGVPRRNADRLTTFAGGWYHLTNAFDADRFERAVTKTGAASYSVGMPNFVSLYALNASLRYLESVGIPAIEQHANPLVRMMQDGLVSLGLEPMCPHRPEYPSGIVAFQHDQVVRIHAALEKENVHVMHHAGRIRIAIHGYNTESDVKFTLSVLGSCL